MVDSGTNGLTLLGDIFMQHWHVVFDRMNHRIGFGDLNTCPQQHTGIVISTGILKHLDVVLFIVALYAAAVFAAFFSNK